MNCSGICLGKSILRIYVKRQRYGMPGQMRKEGWKRLMEDSGEDILFQKLLWMEKFLQMKIILGQLEKKMDS